MTISPKVSQKESHPSPPAYSTMDLACAATNMFATVTMRAPSISTLAKIAFPYAARHVVLIKSSVKGWSCDGSERCPSASSRCGSFCRFSGFWSAVRGVASGQGRFRPGARSYTHAFESGVLELSRHMTIRDVSRFLKVSWDVVKDIQKRNLNKRFAKPKLKKLKQIAIDEISIGKGHRYLTIVLDLKSGAVVFVGDGKGAGRLGAFLAKTPPRGGSRSKR